jgi:hypothetical protein
MRGFFLEGLRPSKPPAMHTMQAEFILLAHAVPGTPRGIGASRQINDRSSLAVAIARQTET